MIEIGLSYLANCQRRCIRLSICEKDDDMRYILPHSVSVAGQVLSHLFERFIGSRAAFVIRHVEDHVDDAGFRVAVRQVEHAANATGKRHRPHVNTSCADVLNHVDHFGEKLALNLEVFELNAAGFVHDEYDVGLIDFFARRFQF